MTNKRLDDINLHLADQSRRIDETNKRTDAMREELSAQLETMNSENSRWWRNRLPAMPFSRFGTWDMRTNIAPWAVPFIWWVLSSAKQTEILW
jgi:hypothetical protein